MLTTAPPSEWPTRSGSIAPTVSTIECTSATSVVTSYGARRSDSPWPRRSTAMTLKSSASGPTRGSHTSWDSVIPCTRIRAGPAPAVVYEMVAPSGAEAVGTCSTLPSGCPRVRGGAATRPVTAWSSGRPRRPGERRRHVTAGARGLHRICFGPGRVSRSCRQPARCRPARRCSAWIDAVEQVHGLRRVGSPAADERR